MELIMEIVPNYPTQQPDAYWPQIMADLDRLRRAANTNGELSSPFAICIGTASSGLTHLESWSHDLNLNSF
jgi:hypothetical protein